MSGYGYAEKKLKTSRKEENYCGICGDEIDKAHLLCARCVDAVANDRRQLESK